VRVQSISEQSETEVARQSCHSWAETKTKEREMTMLRKTILFIMAAAGVVAMGAGGCSDTCPDCVCELTCPTEPVFGPESITTWDILVAEVIEEIPLIYPDTQAAYLLKDVPPDPNVAYRVEFTLPYATYSSTTIYENTKPIAALRDAQYGMWTGGLNPYQPGNKIMTNREERKVVVYVTPDFDAAVAQGVENPIAIV